MINLRYPCTDCTEDVLVPVTDTICECATCGHPQDIPSISQLDSYWQELADDAEVRSIED